MGRARTALNPESHEQQRIVHEGENQNKNNPRRVSTWDQGPPTVPTTSHDGSASWNSPTPIPERESVLRNMSWTTATWQGRTQCRQVLCGHKQKAPAHRQKAKSPGLHAAVSSSSQHAFTLLLLQTGTREKEELLKAMLTQLLWVFMNYLQWSKQSTLAWCYIYFKDLTRQN